MEIPEKQPSFFKCAGVLRARIAVLSFVYFAATGCNLTGPDAPEPRFNNLMPMAGKRFVAYTSPDPAVKPDTVLFSWNHPGILPDSTEITALLDSGAIRIPLKNLSQAADNRTSLTWVPGADTMHFGYFGIKTCILHLSDLRSGAESESEPFAIIGSQPLLIQSPAGNTRFSLNDTITINYLINSDRISNIRVFFMTDSMANWMEIRNSPKRISDNAPIRAFSTVFTPDEWLSKAPIHPGSTLRFLCKDYNSPLPNSSSVSGEITLE